MDVCPQNHPIRSSNDRTAQGFCRICHRQANRDLRRRNRDRIELARALEAMSPAELADRLAAL